MVASSHLPIWNRTHCRSTAYRLRDRVVYVTSQYAYLACHVGDDRVRFEGCGFDKV
jgi:hypothetical protein